MVCIRLRQENCKPDKIPLLRADICALLQVDLQASRLLWLLLLWPSMQSVLRLGHLFLFLFLCFLLHEGIGLSRSTFFQFFSENMKIISGFSPAFTIAHYNVADIIGHLSGLSDTFVSALKTSFRVEPSLSFRVLSSSAALSLLWPSMQPALRLGHLYLFLLIYFLLHEGIGLEQNHFLFIFLWKHENYNVDFQQHLL